MLGVCKAVPPLTFANKPGNGSIKTPWEVLPYIACSEVKDSACLDLQKDKYNLSHRK